MWPGTGWNPPGRGRSTCVGPTLISLLLQGPSSQSVTHGMPTAAFLGHHSSPFFPRLFRKVTVITSCSWLFRLIYGLMASRMQLHMHSEPYFVRYCAIHSSQFPVPLSKKSFLAGTHYSHDYFWSILRSPTIKPNYAWIFWKRHTFREHFLYILKVKMFQSRCTHSMERLDEEQ